MVNHENGAVQKLAHLRSQTVMPSRKCVICKTGETRIGKTTLTLQRGDTVIVIKDVPAQVCEDCGEYYLDEPVARRVYAQADEAVRRRTEVEILRYAA